MANKLLMERLALHGAIWASDACLPTSPPGSHCSVNVLEEGWKPFNYGCVCSCSICVFPRVLAKHVCVGKASTDVSCYLTCNCAHSWQLFLLSHTTVAPDHQDESVCVPLGLIKLVRVSSYCMTNQNCCRKTHAETVTHTVGHTFILMLTLYSQDVQNNIHYTFILKTLKHLNSAFHV